jgi:hypothetical protein
MNFLIVIQNGFRPFILFPYAHKKSADKTLYYLFLRGYRLPNAQISESSPRHQRERRHLIFLSIFLKLSILRKNSNKN